MRERFTRGPLAPVLVGIATALVMAAVFGSLQRSYAFHDETAYLLQAKIFASGRWTAEARPLPEFFQEIHSFDTPIVAARYWPGHAIMLVPGVALGMPALMPILLAGVMGGLMFALARRVAGSLAAILGWLVWVSAPDVLYFQPTYFSELTTGALLLLGWWSLFEYHEGKSKLWLLVLAFCFGWGAITRPLTMLAYAIPVAVVLFRDLARRRSWRDLLAPLAVGCACLALVPVWNVKTMGNWRTIPYTEYARRYLPVDRPGFLTVNTAPPIREMPWDLAEVSRKLTEFHKQHTPSTLHIILGQRLYDIGKGMWGYSRLVLLPFALLSVVAWSAGATFALVSAATLVLVYLIFPYDRGWTVYYVELFPVLGFLTGVGLAVASRWVVRRLQSSSVPPVVVRRGVLAMGIIYGACGFFHLMGEVGLARAKQDYLRREQVAFATAIAPIRDSAAVVFIRYAPGHSPHLSLIDNGPDLDRVRIWEVYDRGADNERLMQHFPHRVPYLYDEAGGTVRRLSS
jgi:hypothetical protein